MPGVPVDAEWLHALRNAVNAATISTAAARSAFESGDIERAVRFLCESESASLRAADLLHQDPVRGS